MTTVGSKPPGVAGITVGGCIPPTKKPDVDVLNDALKRAGGVDALQRRDPWNMSRHELQRSLGSLGVPRGALLDASTHDMKLAFAELKRAIGA